MDQPFDRRLRLGFATALLAVILAGVMAYRSAQTLLQTSLGIAHTHLVVNEVMNTAQALQQAAGALNAFVNGGSPQQEDLYRRSLRAGILHMQHLHTLHVNDPLWRELFSAVQRDTERLGPEMEASLLQYQEGHVLAARQIFDAGDEDRQRVQGGLAELQVLTSRPLTDLSDNARRDGRQTLPWILAGGGLAILLLGVAYQRMRFDMAGRRRAEHALQQSEARHHAVVEQSAEGILLYDAADGTVLDSNPALQQLLGYSAQELGCLTVSELEIADSPRLSRQAGSAAAYRSKSGHPVEVEVKATPIVFEGRRVICAMVRDIRQRLHWERQLRQSQKMEAVGRLAGGVAHDFNNLLTVILGYSQLLLARLSLEDPSRAPVTQIHVAADRAAAMTRQLLAFSRHHVTVQELFNVNSRLEQLGDMLQRLIGEDIGLVLRYGADLGQVRADPSQIEQVILNLVVNARDAMPLGGNLIVETQNVEIDEGYSRQHAHVGPGSYVLLAVTDSGVGMTAETQAHIFEPFFTTKGPGHGTGLGLATVYAIVQQSGGFVWVYSEPGLGTTFKVYLPCVASVAETEPTAPAVVESPPDASATVLLVEDEAGVRELAHAVLSEAGYQVLVADGPQTALRFGRQHPTPIDLVLTDVVMPQMNGWQTYRALREFRPEVRVLFMSGYSSESVVERGLVDLDRAFLQKPFSPPALLAKVREVLETPARPSTAPALQS